MPSQLPNNPAKSPKVPPETLSLAGKVAIITGSGRENGIGAGIALALARNGASVTINYVSDSVTPRAQALAETLKEVGAEKVVVAQADVSTREGAREIVRMTLEGMGVDHIDILGTGWVAPTLEVTAENLDRTIDVNLKGPVLVSQAVVPHMPPGGRVINVSSTNSRVAPRLLALYNATKAALDNLTLTWAGEWGRSRGITVNSVAPGPVITDIQPKEEAAQKVVTKPQVDMTRAADRPGTKEDLGDAVLLLVQEKARWITGQYISVSGGVTGM